MKTLTRKSQITAKELKTNDVDFKGNRLGFDKDEKLYLVGSHFNTQVTYYGTVAELKFML